MIIMLTVNSIEALRRSILCLVQDQLCGGEFSPRKICAEPITYASIITQLMKKMRSKWG